MRAHDRPRRRRRKLHPATRRDTRPRRRVRMRQDHHSKLIMRLIEPSSGSIKVEGFEAVSLGRRGLRLSAPRADDLPGPLRLHEPALQSQGRAREPLLIHHIGATRKDGWPWSKIMEKVKMTPWATTSTATRTCSRAARGSASPRTHAHSPPEHHRRDEPVSMIDLSTRAEILHLMKTIQAEMELSFIYITHDISTPAISPTHRVMYLAA